MYKLDGLGNLKLANSSWLSSLVASLWDPYYFKLANGNTYKLDGLSHLKLTNSTWLSSLVASLWNPDLFKLANGNVYKLDLLVSSKLANWTSLLYSVGEIWMLRGRTPVQASVLIMHRSNEQVMM